MSWFKRLLPKISTAEKKGVPEGIWTKCQACEAVLYRAELERSFYVCPKCDYHMRVTAQQRLVISLDYVNKTERIAENITAVDRLKFRDSKKYKDRLSAAQKETGESEALIAIKGTIRELPVVAIAFEFNFIGGSMSYAVGERFAQAIKVAILEKRPVVCFSTSGGARMQEGLFSLFQMAKTATALAQLSHAKLPFISVLTDPTMGGVSASLATLGDIIIAEPKALMGFAGPRVIEQTIRQTLPEGFQRSEFLLTHGAIDMIVHRHQMKDTLYRLLSHLMPVSAL